MKHSATRENILQAAYRLIQRESVKQLTLEAVAREAGVSKGGVFYHFASKDALITGMIDALCERFATALPLLTAGTAHPTPGQFLRAYIQATCLSEEPLPEARSLIAALATNPSLLEPLKRWSVVWQQRAEQDGVPVATATLLRLAVDGWWFSQLVGFALPQGSLRQQVIELMLALTQQRTQEP